MHTGLCKDKDKLAKMTLAEKTHWEKTYPFKQQYDICFCYKNVNNLPLKVSIKPSRPSFLTNDQTHSGFNFNLI